jgi:hypothetical protein
MLIAEYSKIQLPLGSVKAGQKSNSRPFGILSRRRLSLFLISLAPAGGVAKTCRNFSPLLPAPPCPSALT